MPKLTTTIAGKTTTVEVTDSCSIGRMPGNTIVLEDEVGASRRHCQILKIAGGFELADLGSTNGTKVNGQPVKRHKLKDGDEIRIGETVLKWTDGTGAPAEDEVVLEEGDVQLEEPAGAAPVKSAAAATSEQCYLVFAGGPKDGQKVELAKKRVTFGRNPKNTFAFPDDMGVSGYHCEVAREGGAYVLRDLGSTNGTLVDGEQVTEIALQHGNRVRIGAQRLVFVDTSVADFEKAMSAVEDLGSEWGLLRAEMDMTRVQQARRSQMVGVGALVLVLVAAGYVAIAHPEWISGGEKPPKPVAGNLIPVTDFSFEGLAGSWTTPPGSPGQGRFAEAGGGDGAAFQGKGFYAVTRDGALGRGAAVAIATKDLIRVNPSSAYAFGARVRTKGDAQACVRVTWFAADGVTEAGQSATDLVSSQDWTEARGAVPRPPVDAASARIELVDAASGTAYFDDVFFAQAAERPNAPEIKGGDIALSVTPDAQMTLRRGSVTLFSDMAAVGGALREESLDGTRRTDRVGSRKGTTVTASGVAGQTLDAVRGQWTNYAVKAAVAEDRYVDLEVDLGGADGSADGGGEAALIGLLATESVTEGVGVRTETSYFRMSEVRLVEKVRSVTFGERNRYEIAAAEGSPSFRLALMKVGERWAFALGGKGLKLRIDTDTKALKRAVEELETAARDAEARRRFGDAVKLNRELAAKLPQGSQTAASASEKAERFEKAAQDEAAKIQTGRAAAVEFQDVGELGALQARAAELKERYEGHPVAEIAVAEIAAIQEALAKRRVVLDERAAVPIALKADDFAAHEDHAIAAALYRGIISQYPGTEAAKRAKDALDKLPAGK